MIAMLLLWLVDVPLEEIVADYELSTERLPRLFARRGEPDAGPLIAEFLRELGTSFEAIIRETLTSIDREAWMRAGGLTNADREVLRARFVSG